MRDLPKILFRFLIISHAVLHNQETLILQNILQWLLLKSEHRHMTNINQKRNWNIKIKCQCSYYAFATLQTWTACAPDAVRMCSYAQNLQGMPEFSRAHILTCIKKTTTLDQKRFSQKDKKIKKLQWIRDTNANTSVLKIFW